MDNRVAIPRRYLVNAGNTEGACYLMYRCIKEAGGPVNIVNGQYVIDDGWELEKTEDPASEHLVYTWRAVGQVCLANS